MMRTASVTLLLMVLLAGWPARAGAQDAGRDFGLAGGAVGVNLLYTPPKLLTALIGLPLGAMTGLFTGGDLRSMYAVWVPTVTGTYFLTPAHLEGTKPIEFFGSHYPAGLAPATDAGTTGTHDARYAAAPSRAP